MGAVDEHRLPELPDLPVSAAVDVVEKVYQPRYHERVQQEDEEEEGIAHGLRSRRSRNAIYRFRAFAAEREAARAAPMDCPD